MREKQYIISEDNLIYLLMAEMELEANRRDGVDNWKDYGLSREEVLFEYFPGEVSENIYLDFYQVAKARLEAGEFPEMLNLEELLNI